MTNGLNALKAQLGAMADRDRTELAHFLLDSLGPGHEPEAEASWEAELSGRVADIKEGRVVCRSVDGVIDEPREHFP